MRRVDEDAMWWLFDPKVVPQLFDLYGEDFERAYVDAEVPRVSPQNPGFQQRGFSRRFPYRYLFNCLGGSRAIRQEQLTLKGTQ